MEDTGAPIGFWGVEWKRYEAYVWADGQEVLRFTDSDGLGTTESFHLASRYLWSDQVDQLLAEEQFAGDTGPSVHATTAHTTTGETLWPLTDHLGSVRGLVDNNGIIRQHVAYDSFGNRLVEQHYDTAGAPVAASHAEAVDTLFGYTGRDWDTDTNLQYNRARWYDPSTGRWVSQDPIGFAAGDANLYRYVGNGHVNKTDPTGLQPPFQLPAQDELDEARQRLGRNRAMGGIALAAHGNGLPAGAYGPARSATRPLTPGELAMLNQLFGDLLNTDGLCIGRGGLFPWVERNTMTPRYTPWFPPRNYVEDFSKAGPGLRHHFIHEMTHVLQSQNGNWNWIDGPYQTIKNLGNYSQAYPYDRSQLGRPLYEFNFEQQADIVADYYSGAFTGDELKRCQQTLKGFRTQLPAFVPDRRYLDSDYEAYDNSGWGTPHFVPKRDDSDSIPFGRF